MRRSVMWGGSPISPSWILLTEQGTYQPIGKIDKIDGMKKSEVCSLSLDAKLESPDLRFLTRQVFLGGGTKSSSNTRELTRSIHYLTRKWRTRVARSTCALRQRLLFVRADAVAIAPTFMHPAVSEATNPLGGLGSRSWVCAFSQHQASKDQLAFDAAAAQQRQQHTITDFSCHAKHGSAGSAGSGERRAVQPGS